MGINKKTGVDDVMAYFVHRHSLHIRRLYEAAQNMPIGETKTFKELLTPAQHGMSNRKKSAWLRAFNRWAVGRDEFTVTLLGNDDASCKRNI